MFCFLELIKHATTSETNLQLVEANKSLKSTQISIFDPPSVSVTEFAESKSLENTDLHHLSQRSLSDTDIIKQPSQNQSQQTPNCPICGNLIKEHATDSFSFLVGEQNVNPFRVERICACPCNNNNLLTISKNPKTLPPLRSFSHPNPTTTNSEISSSNKRHRHSIAGQTSYFKMLGFSCGGPLSIKKLTDGSTNSLFSTAVISGSSSAPNLRDMIPTTANASGNNYMLLLY